MPERLAESSGDPVPGGYASSRRGALVDAERFLSLADRLQLLRRRIEESPSAEGRRSRWQRLLLAATDAAQRDLEDAERRLLRLEAELDRHLG